VLKKGFEKFNEMIVKITDGQFEAFDCLTISSLTDKYMKVEGAYDGVFEVCGNLREYIGRAVYGGRVAVNKKYVKKIIKGMISDYDGVSLYPSAIHRLCKELGLFKGKAKRMTEFNSWKSYDYSVMTVQINKVNKHQQIPFIAHKGDGSTKYLNEAPTEPIIIDSITLEDYINFHDIEYEILDGVYWNEGFNKKMGKLIENLFKERLKWKKTNEALQQTIKLMLNSAYGKTIMKKSNTEKIFVRGDYELREVDGEWKNVKTNTLTNYLYNNWNTIKSCDRVNESRFQVERTCVDTSYNRAHIGCAILSMSKRIMNEVFDVANENSYPIFYTDTDSLHLNFEDVPKLEKKYEERYGRVLNGKNLGQFHTDFDLKGAVGDIYATKSIFLGKKSYVDVLESKDKDGNTITGHHIRLKGITEQGLLHKSRELGGYFEMYNRLAKGEKIKFWLNPTTDDEDTNKTLFEYKEGAVMTKVRPFYREVKF
jgi:hypothetical protein